MTAPHYGYWPQPEMAGMQPRLMQPQAPPAMPSLAMKPVPYYPESAHPQMLPSYGAPATYYNHSGAVVQPPPPQQQQHPQAVPPPPTTPPTITYYSNANAGPQVVSPHQHTQPRPRPAVSPSGRLPAHPQPPRMPTSTLWRAPPPVTTTPAHTWVASGMAAHNSSNHTAGRPIIKLPHTQSSGMMNLVTASPQTAPTSHMPKYNPNVIGSRGIVVSQSSYVPPYNKSSPLLQATSSLKTQTSHGQLQSLQQIRDDSIFGDTEKNIAKNFVDILAAQGPQEASSEHIFNCFLKLSPTERKVVMKPGSIKSFLLAMGVITVERNLMSVRPDVLESLYGMCTPKQADPDPEDKALPDEGEEEELDSQQLMFEQKASQHNITIEIAPTAATSAAARRSSSGTYSAQNSLCSEEDEEPPETGAAIRVEEVEKTEVGVNTLTPSTCEQASETEVITRNRRLQVGPPQLAEPNHIACGPDDKGESDFIETIDSLQYDEMVSRAITAEEALLKLRLTMKFNDAINFKTRILAAYNNLSGVQQQAAWPEYERVCAELAACMEDLQSECESNIEQLQEEGVWLRDLVEDKLTLPDVPPLLQEAANTKPLEVVHRTPVVEDEVETKAQPVGTAPAPPQPAVSGTHPHMPAGPQTTSNPAPLQGWPSQQVPNSSCLNSGSSTTSITTVATTPADLTTTTTATTTTTTSTNISASTPSPLATPQVMVNPLALLNQQALVSAQGMPPNQQGLANPQCLPVARPGVPLGAPQGIPTPQGMVSPHLLPMLQPMMMSLARVNPALAMQPQLLQNTALQHLLTMQRAGMGLPSSAPSQQSAPSPSSTPPPALPSPSAMAAVPAGLGNVSPASSLGSGTFPALNPFMLPAGNMPMLPMPVVSSSPSLSATSSETGALSSSMQNLLDLQLKQTEASLSMGGLPTATSGAAALNQYAMFQQRLLSSASSTLPSFLEMQMKTTMQSTLAAMQSTTQVTSVNQAPAPSTLPAPAPAPAPAPSTTLPAPSVSSAPVAVSAPAVSQATPPTPTGNISRPPGFGVSDTGKQNNLPVLNIPVSKKTREPSPASSHSSSSKPRKPSTPKLTKKETDTKLTTNTAANVENKPQEKPIAVPKKTAAKKIPQVIKLVQKQKQEQVQPQSPIKQSILPSTYGNSQATYVPQRRDTSLDVTSTENWDDECNSFITQTAFILGKSKIASNRRATTPPVNLDEPKPPPIIPVVTKSLPSSMVYKAEAGSGHKTVVAPAAGDQWPDLRSANGGKDNRSTTTVNKAGGSWNEGIATRRKPLPIIASSIPDQVPVNRIDYGDSSRSLTGTIESGAGHRGGGDSVEKPLKSAKSAPPPPAPTPEKSKVLKESGGGSKQSGGGRLTALDDFTVPETQPTDDEWQESGKRGKKKPKFKTMPAGDGKENSNFDRLVAQMMTKFPDRTKSECIMKLTKEREGVPENNMRWKTSGAEIIESKNVNMGNLLYKTSICEFWKAGNCSNGDKCVYAHGRNDLRAPPKHILCSNWKKLGRCPRASTCLFAHGETELVPATVPPAGKVKKTLKQLHEKKAPPATSTSAITWAQIPNTKNQVQAQADSQESDEEEDEGEECTICCDAMSQKTLKKLECGHEFHASCITRWIEGEERTCPLCRSHALLIEDYPYLGQ